MSPGDERFDRDISASTRQAFYFRDDVALFRIEHNIGAHSLRHFHPHWVAIHADNERCAH